MKRAREIKSKPNWKTIVLQSLQFGEVGNVYRATQHMDGQKALDHQIVIGFIERGNFEAFKIALPHLSAAHFRKTLNCCARDGHTKELELCLQHANSEDVESATRMVLIGQHHNALPLIVEHLGRFTYSRDQRERLIEAAAREGNAKGLKTLLKLYPQSSKIVYNAAVLEGIYSENPNVLTLLLPTIKRFNSQQSAKALEYAVKYNDKALSYVIEHAVAPEFDPRDLWDIVNSANARVESLQKIVHYWNIDLLDHALKIAKENADVKDFLTTHRQKQVLLSHVESRKAEPTASLRVRKM